MHQIKTQLADFSAAHRVVNGYQGKCRNLHGHNYRTFVTFSASGLDELGFVIDFGDVKALCNDWVQDNWDHSIIIASNDQPLLEFASLQKQDHYIIPGNRNTTVEVLAQHLFEIMSPRIEQELIPKNESLRLVEIEMWETQNSCARYVNTA